MIVFDGVSVRVDGAKLVDDVSLTIDQHRVAVIGANGSGKTTLVRLINGLTSASAGSVIVDGIDVGEEPKQAQRRVGFVFQDADHQLVYPTPAEDVALGLRARKVTGADADRRARTLLARLGVGDVADQGIHTLSGGEKHLVALAAVLVLEPAWVVLDEPTTSLDLRNRGRVVQAIAALEERVVIVSHDLDLVRECDRAILMDAGRVVADGAPDVVVDTYLSQIVEAV